MKFKKNLFNEESVSLKMTKKALSHKKKKFNIKSINKSNIAFLSLIVFLIANFCAFFIYFFLKRKKNKNMLSLANFNSNNTYNSMELNNNIFNNTNTANNTIIDNITNNSNNTIIDNIMNNSNNTNTVNNTIIYNITNNTTIVNNTIIDNITNNSNKTNTVNNNIIDNITNNKENIIDKKKLEKLKEEEEKEKERALQSGREYLKKCQNGELIINKTIDKEINEPKISVIIPVFNCQKTIKASVRSIQNQNMSDLEIILVNDNSNSETVNIIKQLQEEDKRIKIINNKKNMGTFYSRSIGALSATGKYITTLDNDDMFLDKDVFDITYNEAKKDNIDIIGFKVFESPNFDLKFYKENYLNKKEINKIIRQPELSIDPITKDGKLYPNNIYIWGKIIITGVYKAAVNLIGEERYSEFIVWVEDTSIYYVICNVAQTYKFIGKFGLYHYYSSSTASIMQSREARSYAEIFLTDIIFDFSKNNYKNYAAYKLLKIKEYSFFSVSNENIKSHLQTLFNKIINCSYIKKELKEELKKKYEGIILISKNNNNI